jgi:hypothetical protein
LGRQIEIMHAWLDQTCGVDGWATAPAGLIGVINDAIAFYFHSAAFAHAFAIPAIGSKVSRAPFLFATTRRLNAAAPRSIRPREWSSRIADQLMVRFIE